MSSSVSSPLPDRSRPTISLRAAFHADAPFASYAAARAVTEYPTWTPTDAEVPGLVRRAVALTEPAVAEASSHTLEVWHDGPAVAYARIGGFIAVRLRAETGAVRLVALPGAVTTTPPVVALLLELFASHEVRFVSEATSDALAPALAAGGLVAAPERNEFDYVYRMADLATLAGPGRRKARREAARFASAHGDRIELREGRLDEIWAHRFLYEMYRRWVLSKFGGGHETPEPIRKEWNGVLRTPTDQRVADVRVFALSVDGRPVGVSVIEPMWAHTWMGTVMKTDRAFPGATAYLRRHVCRAGLAELGSGGLLNLQQDDGDLGLRRSKLAYGPTRLEPKFAIVPATGAHR